MIKYVLLINGRKLIGIKEKEFTKKVKERAVKNVEGNINDVCKSILDQQRRLIVKLKVVCKKTKTRGNWMRGFRVVASKKSNLIFGRNFHFQNVQ